DVGDGHAGGVLDLDVAVAERQAQPPGEAATDRGFPHAHQPDQSYGALLDGNRFEVVRRHGSAPLYTKPSRGKAGDGMSTPQIEAFLEMMAVERAASRHTLDAYGRDLADAEG